MADADDILQDWSFQALFWAKVTVVAPTRCWEWKGGNNGRYGVFCIRRKAALATHIALALAGRPRPPFPNDKALHSSICRTTLCVNPNHLRWGSQAENMEDRDRKASVRPRRKSAPKKLTEELVREVRQSALSDRKVAKDLGIDPRTAGRIRNRDIWAHVA